MTSSLAMVLALLLFQPAQDHAADALAAAVMRAAGGEVWPKVTRIKFTFNVEREGKLVSSISHDWDVRGRTDTVTMSGKTITVNVRHANHEGDQKKAYGRFINDSYWLLAPLKVMDPGVKRSTGESQEIDGQRLQLLHLSFENVGLTPTDQYKMWIDPQTHLVRFWDFIPEPGKQSRMSWEDYKDFNGLKLATRHNMGKAAITFTDVEVTVEQ